jgi:hypothetical protein
MDLRQMMINLVRMWACGTTTYPGQVLSVVIASHELSGTDIPPHCHVEVTLKIVPDNDLIVLTADETAAGIAGYR